MLHYSLILLKTFLKIVLKNKNSIPLSSVSLPDYTWDTGLKFTKVNLEKIQDAEVFLIFENAVGGGISGCMGKR